MTGHLLRRFRLLFYAFVIYFLLLPHYFAAALFVTGRKNGLIKRLFKTIKEENKL